jgi:hypothetical protein
MHQHANVREHLVSIRHNAGRIERIDMWLDIGPVVSAATLTVALFVK